MFFQEDLAEFNFTEVRDAFVYYRRNNPDIPTTCDILQIIEMNRKEKQKKVLSDEERYRAMKGLLDKGGERFVRPQDQEFIAEYEAKMCKPKQYVD